LDEAVASAPIAVVAQLRHATPPLQDAGTIIESWLSADLEWMRFQPSLRLQAALVSGGLT
jgi:hypothetical protein